MREIEYRAWDKEMNRMCEVIAIDLKTKQVIVYSKDEEECSGWLSISRFELIQYTGLKDKNGVKIYEGDILHRGGCWDTRIEFEKGTFKVRSLDLIQYINRTCDCPIYQFPISEYEVIGNIYQNSEILKQEG